MHSISTYIATGTWLSRPIVQVQISRKSTVLIKTIYIFFICTLRTLRSYNLFYQNIKRCKVRTLRLILAMHMYGYLGAGRLIHFSHLFLQYLFNRTCSEAQIFNYMVSKIIFTTIIEAFFFDNLLVLPMYFVYPLLSRIFFPLIFS